MFILHYFKERCQYTNGTNDTNVILKFILMTPSDTKIISTLRRNYFSFLIHIIHEKDFGENFFVGISLLVFGLRSTDYLFDFGLQTKDYFYK